MYQPGGLWLVRGELVEGERLRFEPVSRFGLEGRPNETTLRFLDDDTMVALVRREEGTRSAMIGHAAPPYTEWTWADTRTRIGGPNLVVLEGGVLLAGGRRYGERTATALWQVGLDGSAAELLVLPSGGDTSYPGLLVRGDELWVSYYSSHQGSTSIYLARLRLGALLELR